MKLVRFALGQRQRPRMGVLTPLGVLDAAACWQLYNLAQGDDDTPMPASPRQLFADGAGAIDRLEKAYKWVLSENKEPALLFSPSKVRMLSPVGRPAKIVCIGLNYRDHCKEQGHEVPKSPVVFAKFATAVNGPDHPVVRPKITRELDYEAELAVVIGQGGRHIEEDKALQHVAGYMNFNDISARDIQMGDGQWTRGKSCDTFAPMGPALVTPDEVPDPQNLSIQCRLNGEVVQDSSTRQMIFPVPFLIAFCSRFMTLEAGDVIATGTPPGVGMARKPARFLNPGDVVEVEIEGLGVLRNTIVEED